MDAARSRLVLTAIAVPANSSGFTVALPVKRDKKMSAGSTDFPSCREAAERATTLTLGNEDRGGD
jgi:hypothetical protein